MSCWGIAQVIVELSAQAKLAVEFTAEAVGWGRKQGLIMLVG